MHRLLISTALAASMGAAQALEATYYVHFSASGGWSPVTTSVTRDAADGDTLARPPSACGLQFESASDTDWLSPIPYARDFSGTLKVWMPGAGCGAWSTVVVEGRSQRGQVAQPSGVAGQLRVESARAYWIDKDGNKLVHKNEPCVKNGKNSCSPKPAFRP